MASDSHGRQRVALVGIDGFSPVWMEHFIQAGELPAIARIREVGSSVPLISTLPATTPVAWSSMMTGCMPSVTGIHGFLLHKPGNRFDERIAGVYSDRCHAESIWETASLWGKRAYIIKFPLSYPSKLSALRIDGAAGWGGLTCLHDIASAGIFDTTPDEHEKSRELVRDPSPWKGQPTSKFVPIWQGKLVFESLWGGEAATVFVVLGSLDDGQAAVCVSLNRNWNHASEPLVEGEWSQAFTITSQGRRGETECAFRLKVLSCLSSPPSLRLFNTSLHELHGHTVPHDCWERIFKAAGPIEEHTDPTLFFDGLIDLDTQLELFQLNLNWLKKASLAVLEREEWELFLVHVHFIDWAHHMFHGAIDPRHPYYDPGTASIWEEHLLTAYRMVDDLVAAVDEVAGPDSNVVVVGDHGQDLHHTTFRINAWLEQRKYLCWNGDGGVDWNRTRMYAAGNYIYVNTVGRDPTGIVSKSSVDALIEEVVDALEQATDPSSGARPVLWAAPKNHFEWLGANHEGVGDIVVCLKSGYQARNDAGPVYEITRPLKEFTSGHDHFSPLDPRIQTRFYARGPGFHENYTSPSTHHVIDVTPTLCTILGITPSPQCQGHSITNILRDSALETKL